jgi:hypothetical protein
VRATLLVREVHSLFWIDIAYTSCSAFTSLKRIEPLKWNPHLDECVQALQDQAEYDGDVILAGLVKLQLVLEQTHRAQLPSYDGLARKQPAAFIETLHSQVERIKESLPPDIQQDRKSYLPFDA